MRAEVVLTKNSTRSTSKEGDRLAGLKKKKNGKKNTSAGVVQTKNSKRQGRGSDRLVAASSRGEGSGFALIRESTLKTET